MMGTHGSPHFPPLGFTAAGNEPKLSDQTNNHPQNSETLLSPGDSRTDDATTSLIFIIQLSPCFMYFSPLRAFCTSWVNYDCHFKSLTCNAFYYLWVCECKPSFHLLAELLVRLPAVNCLLLQTKNKESELLHSFMCTFKSCTVLPRDPAGISAVYLL